MALSLKDGKTDRLAREVARLTGESLNEAVRRAFAERLECERRQPGAAKGLDDLAKDCAALPDIHARSPDEIIGYDEYGVPR